MVTRTEAVDDWAHDFDVLDPGYVDDPFGHLGRAPHQLSDRPHRPAGERLAPHPLRRRDRHRPRPRARFSSLDVSVIAGRVGRGPRSHLPYGLPPISADPPLHTWTRRLLLPWFSHRRVECYEASTRALCRPLLDALRRRTTGPTRRSTTPSRSRSGSSPRSSGSPESMSDTFTGWVRDVLEFADDPERRATWELRHRVLPLGTDRRSGARPPVTTCSAPCSTPRSTAQPIDDEHRPRHGDAHPHRGGRHHLERHRLVPVAPGHPRRGPRAPSSREPDLMPDGRRGAAPCLLPGDHGPGRDRRRRVRRLPDEGGGQGADELPRRQPRPRGVRPRRTRCSSTAATTATWPSARASTAAPGRTSPAWSCGSRSRSGWPGFPSSTWRAPSRSPGPAGRSAARATCPVVLS